MACQGFIGSILKMVKVSNECKILCVFKRLLFLKMLSLVLNLLTQNADLLLRSGDEGALLQFMKMVKETSITALGWEIYWQRVVFVEWCPALICQASMIKRC